MLVVPSPITTDAKLVSGIITDAKKKLASERIKTDARHAVWNFDVHRPPHSEHVEHSTLSASSANTVPELIDQKSNVVKNDRVGFYCDELCYVRTRTSKAGVIILYESLFR